MNTTRKNTKNSANTFNNVSNVNVVSTNNGSNMESIASYNNVYEPEAIKISMITLNLASQSKPSPIADSTIIDCKPDYVVEMTQEDYRPIAPVSMFDESLMSLYSKVAVLGLNKKKATEQNVAIRIFHNDRSSVQHKGLLMGSKILKPKGKTNAGYLFQKVATTLRLPKYGYSKGMVWVKIIFKESSILFANMHLPMKKKTANLGLALREKAFTLLLGELQKYMDETTTLIIGGDLNFRMDYSGVNQLTKLLDTKYTNLKELPFPDPSQRRYTCKFKPLSEADESCEMKRLTAVPANAENAEAIAKNLQKECAVGNRIPSRCDRFLYKAAEQKSVEVSYQKALPLSPESDHNALVACVTIS
jgi:hypothetical protein